MRRFDDLDDISSRSIFCYFMVILFYHTWKIHAYGTGL